MFWQLILVVGAWEWRCHVCRWIDSIFSLTLRRQKYQNLRQFFLNAKYSGKWKTFDITLVFLFNLICTALIILIFSLRRQFSLYQLQMEKVWWGRNDTSVLSARSKVHWLCHAGWFLCWEVRALFYSWYLFQGKDNANVDVCLN